MLRTTFRNEHGQSAILIALLMVALIAMLGLVLDGGEAYLSRRDSQDASDSAAFAGVRVLATNPSDNGIRDAINHYAWANHVLTSTQPIAYYLDKNGNQIGAAAQQVGSWGASLPSNATGVVVTTTITAQTLFINVAFGSRQYPVRTVAAAQAGPSGPPSNLMPLAKSCDNPQNHCGFVIGNTYTMWEGIGAGNWGWLWWDPSWGGDPILGDELNPNTPTHKSNNYKDPKGVCPLGSPPEPGCWVAGDTGVQNGTAVKSQMAAWETLGTANPPTPMIIVLYDPLKSYGNGSNATYYIVGFAAFDVLSYQLPQKKVTGRFIQWVTDASICVGCPVSGLSTVTLTQ